MSDGRAGHLYEPGNLLRLSRLFTQDDENKGSQAIEKFVCSYDIGGDGLCRPPFFNSVHIVLLANALVGRKDA